MGNAGGLGTERAGFSPERSGTVALRSPGGGGVRECCHMRRAPRERDNVLGRSDSECKGPEAGPCLGSLGTSRTVWPERVEQMVGDVVREVRGQRAHWATQMATRTLVRVRCGDCGVSFRAVTPT